MPGALWSDSPDRGLYKTTDGGKTWNLVLKGSNLSTGCSDGRDGSDQSEHVFAALWDFRRKGWTFRSGGDRPNGAFGSGLFRSTDGGKTWKEITPENSKGFPKKPYGRLAVAIAPSNPKRVYAFVESTDSALFVSDDGGATWDKRDKSHWMVWRPFYFANLIVDPKNPDRVFKTDGALILSEDAGKELRHGRRFQGAHGDVHDVWIDPTNPQTVFSGDDGGMWYSYNGGSKWWKGEQPAHLAVLSRQRGRRRSRIRSTAACRTTVPGSASRSIPAASPTRSGKTCSMATASRCSPTRLIPITSMPNTRAATSAGSIATPIEARDIQPKPNYKEKLRFNWNTPMALSPNEKGTIYIGAQFLFRSRDHGQTWERISPDLTTNDPEKQKQEQSGGVTVDNSAAEMHTTIYSISESPKDKNVYLGRDRRWQPSAHPRRRKDLEQRRRQRSRACRRIPG